MSVRVDGSIPFGNVCDVQVRSAGDQTIVEFAADPKGGPEALWFCFRLTRLQPGDRPIQLKLILKHLENMLGAGRHAEAVVPVCRADQGQWSRLSPGVAEVAPDGRVTAGWQVTLTGSTMDIALCYPYGQDDVTRLLRRTDSYWQARTIGVSQSARPIVRLSNLVGAEGSDRPGVYLIARQHAGETPGSWVLDGLLHRMATLGDAAPLLWCVPLANIDAINQGWYGKDNFPIDLNRAWGRPPMRHETLVIRQDIHRWARRCRPALAMDFHAPGLHDSGAFVFGVKPGQALAEPVRQWSDLCAESLGEYCSDRFWRIADYPSRWQLPGFTTFMREQMQIPAMTLETAYSYAENGRILGIDDYRQMGRRIADMICRELACRPSDGAS